MASIEYIEAELYPKMDDPNKDLYGVNLTIYVYDPNNDGGKVRITWGNYATETFDIASYGLQDGQNEIGNSLPAGTHEICAEVI